jgi:hypothetical protein
VLPKGTLRFFSGPLGHWQTGNKPPGPAVVRKALTQKRMKKLMLFPLWLACFGFSSFDKPTNYEQIAFDYFLAEVIQSDFADVAALEFKGRTEKSFSSLGRFEFCLAPERLQSHIRAVTRRPVKIRKNIAHDKVKSVAITSFKQSSKAPKLHIYNSVHVADNFYVFLSLKKPNRPLARYVFELNTSGDILRSCKME